MKSDNALAGSGQLFEQEITMDSVGQSCTAFRINEFTYDHEADVLTLSAMISFPGKCKRIALQADLLDEETEQVIASLEEHTVEDTTESIYQYQGDPVNGVPAVNTAFVILYAYWTDSTDAQGEAAILEDELQFGVIYKHEYPQKEKNGYVTFGEGASSQAMELAEKNRELEGREESENIVIALYREPTDTKDLDYLCKFGKIDVDQDGKKKVIRQ